MSDLFFLNELAKQDVKSQSTYTSDNNELSSVNIFIKALNKVSDKIDEAIDNISKLKKPHSTVAERDSEDCLLLVTFVENINLAGKILDEFQKGTSILHDNTPELVNLFTDLNNGFTMARIKLNLFSITHNLKYANETKNTISNILKLFETMKEVVINAQDDT
jgi:hypothetical protein